MKAKDMLLKTAVMVIMSLLLFVPLLRVPFVEAPATGTVVGIESAEDVEAGSIFVLSIYLANATKVDGLGFELYWDPAVVNNTGIKLSDDLSPSSLTVNINQVLGKAKVGLVNTQTPDYITVIENTSIIDLTFEAVGSPGDSTILNLDNVELSDKLVGLYFPDVVTDGFVSYTPEIISISIDPGDINFGKIYKGGSGTSSVTITNDGNVEVSVTAILKSEVPVGFYTSNFKLNNQTVSGWSIPNLGPSASETVVLSLDIPVGTETDFKTAILTFWAEPP